MWSRSNQKRIPALLLSALLLLSGCDAAPEQTQPAQTVQPAAQQEEMLPVMDPNDPSAPAGEKTETVYVKAKPDGTVEEVTVEVLLRGLGDAPLVRDVTTLEDIRNTEGDEDFLRLTDGGLLWENHGEDIHYKGTSKGKLPVTLRITCWLDGQEIAPEQLAGKSGAVRIRFDYENNTRQSVWANGESVTVCAPYAALTVAVLSDHFTNVEAENGRVMDLDGEQAVLGLALPGLSESLNLAGFEPTEEVELPDYVEFTADVTDFQLDFTATVLTPGLLEDLEDADLDKLDELREDMDKLRDAGDELADGVGELADGADTFGGYLRKYTGGMGQLADGAAALASGLNQLDQGVTGLQKRLEEIKKTLEQLTPEQWQALLDRLGQEKLTLEDGTEVELSRIPQAAASLAEDETALLATLAQMQGTIDQWQTYADEATAYAARVEEILAAVPPELTAQANQTAQTQVDTALEGLGLSEEDRAAVLSAIDLSETTGAAEEALQALSALSAPAAPEGFPQAETIQTLTERITGNLAFLQLAAQAIQQQSVEQEQAQELVKALADLAGIDVSGWEGMNPAGVQQLTDGIHQLAQGAKALRDGARAMEQAGGALNEGYGKLLEGMDALKEGVDTFNREGIQELTDLTGPDYRSLVARVRAVKELDSGEHSFTGRGEAEKAGVRYIIETEAVGK